LLKLLQVLLLERVKPKRKSELPTDSILYLTFLSLIFFLRSIFINFVCIVNLYFINLKLIFK
jgi:hypothetical protein